jgi:alkylation response protein AidB-like acyl-CoA dehydrogenase
MDVIDLENIDTDAPIFDPQAFGLGDDEAELNALARRLGRSRFALRAAQYDRDASFPTENYRDMREAGLLGVCVPKDHGGLGANFRTYSTTAAEVGRYCGANAESAPRRRRHRSRHPPFRTYNRGSPSAIGRHSSGLQ